MDWILGNPNPNIWIRFMANASYTQSFLTRTQHIFLISKNALYFENKNPELKIIYSGKINP